MELYLNKLFTIINKHKQDKKESHRRIFLQKPNNSINHFKNFFHVKINNSKLNEKLDKKYNNETEYIKGLILNKFNISSIRHTSLSPFTRECFNNLEYLSLKYNYIRNLHFIKYLPNLYYLDISDNPLEEIEILNTKNVFGYLKLSLDSFYEKKILNISGLYCGIFEINLSEESLFPLFKNNNPFLCMFNNQINYFYDKVVYEEDKFSKRRRNSFKTNKNIFDILNEEKEKEKKKVEYNKKEGKKGNDNFIDKSVNRKNKRNSINFNDKNKIKRKLKRTNSIKIKDAFINCYNYGFKSKEFLNDIKIIQKNKIFKNKIKNDGLIKIKNYFDEYNDKIINICDNCSIRDKKSKLPVKSKNLKNYKDYLLLEKRKLILLNSIYQKISIFNQEKKSNKFYINNKEFINVNPFLDHIEIFKLKNYIKLIDTNPNIAIIVLIVLLFYCIGIISNVMMNTLIGHLLVKYYKYNDLINIPFFENENTNFHFLSYYFDNFENIKKKFNYSDIKDNKILDILDILEMKKIILKSNELFSKKRDFKNLYIYDNNRLMEQINYLISLNIKEEILILLNYLYDFIIYDNIEQLLINKGYPNEYSCLIKLKEMMKKKEFNQKEDKLALSEKKYQKNQVEILYNKFYFKLYKIEEIKNSNFFINKKKNNLKSLRNNIKKENELDEYLNTEGIKDINKCLIIENNINKKDLNLHYRKLSNNNQIFKKINLAKSLKNDMIFKEYVKNHDELKLKKNILKLDYGKNNKKDISSMTCRLEKNNYYKKNNNIINSNENINIEDKNNLLLKTLNNFNINNKFYILNNKRLLYNNYNKSNNKFKKILNAPEDYMFRTFSNNKVLASLFEKKFSEKDLIIKQYNSNTIKKEKRNINNIDDLLDIINGENKKMYIRNIAKSVSLRNAERIYSKKKKDFLFLTLNNENNLTEKGNINNKNSERKFNINNDFPSLDIQKYNQKEMSRIILNYKYRKDKEYSKTIQNNI